MILLDTHIWVWLADESDDLSRRHQDVIQRHHDSGLGVSVVSCWEVAKLVELDRLELTADVSNWIEGALSITGVRLLDLTPEVAIESTQLPGVFHKDPADQMIVATARVYGVKLATEDVKIKKYEHVETI